MLRALRLADAGQRGVLERALGDPDLDEHRADRVPRHRRRQRGAGLGRGPARRRARLGRSRPSTTCRAEPRARARRARRSSPSGAPHDPSRRRRSRPRRAVRRLPPRRRRPRRHRARGRRRARAAGPAPCRCDGFRFDTGPTVLTMPHLVDRCFEAAGVDAARPPRPAPGRPDVPGVLRRRQRAARAARREAMTEEIRARLRTTGGGRVRRASATGSPASTSSRCRAFIERNLRLAPRPRRARCGPRSTSCGSGALPAARHGRRAALRRRAPPAHLQLPVDVRRPGAVRGARDLRGHHLHGHRQRRVRPRRRHARAARGAGRPRPRRPGPRSATTTPVERILLARGHLRARSAASASPAARWSPPTPWWPTPTSPSPTARSSRARRRRGRLGAGDYSPSAVVWHVGVRGRPAAGRRAPQHPLRPRLGRRLPGHPPRRRPDARPVAPRQRADVARAVDGARRVATCALRARAGAEPRRPGRLDRRSGARPATTCSRHLDRLGYPTDIEVEELVDPLDWEAQGMERGTPFALSHRFLQTGPFRPGNLERRAPGLGVRRLGHGAGRRRADGAGVGDARRRSGSRSMEAR